MAGSRPGALIATAWTSLVHTGMSGYLQATKTMMEVWKCGRISIFFLLRCSHHKSKTAKPATRQGVRCGMGYSEGFAARASGSEG